MGETDHLKVSQRTPPVGAGSLERDMLRAICLVSLFAILWAGGCADDGPWHVRLSAVAESVTSPVEPAVFRRVAAGADRPAVRDQRRQRPLNWTVVDDDAVDLSTFDLKNRPRPVSAVVRDGTSIDRRSTGGAGVIWQDRGRSLTLHANSLRDCFYHATLGEATAMLHLDLAPGEVRRIQCESYWANGVQSQAIDAPESLGNQASPRRNPPPDRNEIPGNRSRGALVLETPPIWRLSSATPESYAPTAGAVDVTVEVLAGSDDPSDEAGPQLTIRGDTIRTRSLPHSLELVVRNHGDRTARGAITFRVFSFNDANREHQLFKESLQFSDQERIWDRWSEAWHITGSTAPRNAAIAVRVRLPR